MSENVLAILLAAGEGTRMKSSLPKVLHKVGGLPMVSHVIKALDASGCGDIAVVVGNQAERVSKTIADFGDNIETYVQTERLGTAHAVLAAEGAISKCEPEYVIIAYGDTPLVTPKLFDTILVALKSDADVTVLGFETENPFGYGRLLTEGNELVAIREEQDASEEERKVKLCNSGIMGVRGAHVLDLLKSVGCENAKSEYYLTDIVELGRSRGLNVAAVVGDEVDTLGVNNRIELAEAEGIFQERTRRQMMTDGVTLIDPSSTIFSFDTKIGQDTIIEPNCVFAPGVEIASNVEIKANTYLEGDLKKKLIVKVASGAVVGPFARLRPGADLAEGVKIGNFCEVKNAKIDKDAKVNHLTYIGDATIGEGANIGAGTITCNYDGFDKFQTTIGKGAFVGSNSSLVAPVTIDDGAFVGSGSVITKSIPEDALGISRSRQQNKPGWVAKFRALKKK